jgi:osmotically inducible protein OsmC
MNTATLSENITTTEPAKVVYTAKTHTTGGRDGGASRSSDGRLNVSFSLPGQPGNGTNPEQMLAAGWSACFLSALKILAGKRKMRLPPDATIDAEVDLCNGDDGHFLQARLNVSLPGVEREVAQALVEAAHQTCPYSKATHGNINVTTNII